MTEEDLIREIGSLPLDAQRQIEDLVVSLRERYQANSSNPTSSPTLEEDPFFGIWRDREELKDSSAWVRDVRETHWGR